jgi:hypothetical protein
LCAIGCRPDQREPMLHAAAHVPRPSRLATQSTDPRRLCRRSKSKRQQSMAPMLAVSKFRSTLSALVLQRTLRCKPVQDERRGALPCGGGVCPVCPRSIAGGPLETLRGQRRPRRVRDQWFARLRLSRTLRCPGNVYTVGSLTPSNCAHTVGYSAGLGGKGSA